MDFRKPDYDVTNTVHLTDPKAVGDALCALMTGTHAGIDVQPIRDAVELFTKLFAGVYPGFHGCDTRYHDAQHSLDVTLAMARLLAGHDRNAQPDEQLGPKRVALGILCALFHDSGYLRRFSETDIHKGAQLTLTHVTRSGKLLAEFLPTFGFDDDAALCRELMQYTGYEKPLEKVDVTDPKDRRVGFMLGTADLMAQMSDRCYPEKCLRYLYHEFEICGIAGRPSKGGAAPIYESPEDLLRKTPQFARKMFEERLDGYFEQSYKWFDAFFGGSNPYLEQIERHLQFIRDVISSGEMDLLRRQPQTVNGRKLRQELHVELSKLHPHRQQTLN